MSTYIDNHESGYLVMIIGVSMYTQFTDNFLSEKKTGISKHRRNFR